jgi:hypothetical protein
MTNVTGLPLTTGVTGTLPVANGGTGITSFGTGVATWLGTPTSANLAAAVTDETGSGSLVFATSPSLTTPTIGGGGANFSGSTSGTTNFKAAAVAGATTITMPATTGTMALTSDITTVNNGTLTMNVSGTGLSGSQTFTANQASAATFTVTSNATNANTASTIVARDASGNFSAGTITATLSGNATNVTGTVAVANGGTGVTTSTGSGNNVLSTSPTLVTPLLGTPTSGVLTNCTGYTTANLSGTINLTTQVTGTLPIANGGTNSTATATAGGVGYGTGTAHAYTAVGTSGQVLISNAASAPTWSSSLTAVAVALPSTSPFLQNATTLSANLTISSNNAMATGPITINTGIALTVSSGCRVVIL